MKLSTEIRSVSRLVGEEEAIRLLAAAGFEAWDFSMFGMAKFDWNTNLLGHSDHPLASADYIKFAKELREIGLANGIECNQSHAPFPLYCDEMRGDMMKRAIECTAIAGGKICVIHPHNLWNAEENAEIYLNLLPFAKEHGVKLATENMWNWDNEKDEALPAACSHHDDFLKHVEAVNDPYMVACLDLGHAEMRGLNTTAEKQIRTLGKHLQALHIHDNDRWRDSHQIPLSMDMDFDSIVKALKEINYQGDFTLEAVSYLKNHTEDNVLDGLKDMASAARTLVCMFDKA